MPFGFWNAPAAFQALIKEDLFNLLDKLVVVYLYDILIFSPNVETRHTHITQVLSRLCNNNLYCKMEKCDFYCKEVDFLGYAIN